MFISSVSTPALIEEVKKRPQLWDLNHKGARDAALTDKNWEEVSQIFGGEKGDLKIKWKNLKDTYRRELRKMITGKKSNRQWAYYDLMEFLKEDMMVNIFRKIVHDTAKNDDKLNETASKIIDEVTENKRKRKAETNYEPIAERNEQNDDDDLNFFKSLTPFLKTMDLIQKLNVRNKIQQIILEELHKNNLQEITSIPTETSEFHFMIPSNSTEVMTTDDIVVKEECVIDSTFKVPEIMIGAPDPNIEHG